MTTVVVAPDLPQLLAALAAAEHEPAIDGAASFLRTVVDALQRGERVTVLPADRDLTIPEVAAIVGEPEDKVKRLLDTGRHPSHVVAGQRLMRPADVAEFKRHREVTREAFAEMARISQEAGLYDVTPEQVQEAIRQVRRERRELQGRRD